MKIFKFHGILRSIVYWIPAGGDGNSLHVGIVGGIIDVREGSACPISSTEVEVPDGWVDDVRKLYRLQCDLSRGNVAERLQRGGASRSQLLSSNTDWPTHTFNITMDPEFSWAVPSDFIAQIRGIPADGVVAGASMPDTGGEGGV